MRHCTLSNLFVACRHSSGYLRLLCSLRKCANNQELDRSFTINIGTMLKMGRLYTVKVGNSF